MSVGLQHCNTRDPCKGKSIRNYAQKLFSLNERRRYFVYFSFSFELVGPEFAQEFTLWHVCFDQGDELVLVPGLLARNPFGLVPVSSQLLVQLLQFLVLVLQQFTVVALDIIDPLQTFVPAFQEHLVAIAACLEVSVHFLLPENQLVFVSFVLEVLDSAWEFLRGEGSTLEAA